MDIEIKDLFFIGTQLIIVTSVIVNNRLSIAFLKEQSKEQQGLLEKLQDKVSDIRAKIGV
ncbi:MAG: hypothetical protein ACI9LM_000097 [Alteromonadaceae bacterium]|jgi:hypothetical protein